MSGSSIGRTAFPLLGIILLSMTTGAVTTTLPEAGVTVEVVEENVSITMEKRFPFSTVTVWDDHIEIDGNLIYIRSGTAAEINATLWTYNLTNASDGAEILRIGTAAPKGSTVTFRFTGIPPIAEGNYTLHRDGEPVETFYDGGTVQWTTTDWSRHNHSLIAHRPPTDGESGGDQSDGGSSSTGEDTRPTTPTPPETDDTNDSSIPLPLVGGLIFLAAIALGGGYVLHRRAGGGAGGHECPTCGDTFRSRAAFNVHRSKHRLAAGADVGDGEPSIQQELVQLSEALLGDVHAGIGQRDALLQALDAAERGVEGGDWEQVEDALTDIKTILEHSGA